MESYFAKKSGGKTLTIFEVTLNVQMEKFKGKKFLINQMEHFMIDWNLTMKTLISTFLSSWYSIGT